MAYILVEGPDPTDLTKRATMKIDILDQGLLLVVQAMCSHYAYQPTVPNPEYDATIPQQIDGVDNPDYKPETIVNPIGPGTFALMQTVKFWMDHGRAYAGHQGAIAGKAQALEEVKPLEEVSYSQVS